MGVMSSLEKLFVNKFNERISRNAFQVVSDALTLPQESSVLELGAGRGALSHLLYEHYRPKRIAVTDYDPLQLKEAKLYFQKKLRSIPAGVEFRVADALNLPFEDESFDAAFAMLVLHHLENHQWQFRHIPRALDEIKRVLKQEGSFVFEEVFKKNEITSHLEQNGFFRETSMKGSWWVSKFFVYRKTLAAQENNDSN
jgi:ubiquinone/menaquinone biosynthesis C-methylase UbiE